MEQVIPISTLHLFPVLDKLLMELLASLSAEDWHKPTFARQWNVKDIAAHLLDGNIRAIAALNGYQNNEPPPQINSYQDLIAFLNELNGVWIKAMKRVSPDLLVSQLQSTGEQYIRYLHTLPPFEQATYAVAWAGEATSLNWFHIAREYTEKWHHQQQIRDAVGAAPLLFTRELFYPLIDTFMYALPHSYRLTPALPGTVIQFTIGGEAGGHWYLQKGMDNWILFKHLPVKVANAKVTIQPEIAWKFFTKAITPDAARESSLLQGDFKLASQVFNTLAIMA